MEKVSLSNKVFTENPLLDELVYNARQLATGVILKDEDKANDNETAKSIADGDTYVAINRGSAHFYTFKYDERVLSKYYTSKAEIEKYANNNDLIPQEDRPILLKLASDMFTENYVETNNYYRMLHGLPPYDEQQIWEGLFIDTRFINDEVPTSIDHISNFYKEEYEYDDEGHAIVVSDYQPIHELNLSYKNIIYENGTCENIMNSDAQLVAWNLTKDDVRYIMHIGDREVGYYEARIADKFALLYCPNCASEEVKRRFRDLFEANRLYLLYTIYSSAYKLRSDYYDNFMMIFLIIQTIIDMIVELPEYIIRRDIFDTRTCKYIFEANGVRYFKDIPLKYQVSLVKNLNKLIKFKSTDKCIVDIISIFGVENMEVFKYYIMKDRNLIDKKALDYLDNKKEVTRQGVTTIEDDNDKNYELRFIKVPLLDSYDEHIRTDKNIYSYDTMTETDNYWIGDKEYDIVKSDIKNLDFTVLRSKYYSIEAVIDIAKRNFTLVYFMNILMYNNIDKSNLKVNAPIVSTKKKFELIDIILTLFSLSYVYYNVEDTILDTRSKTAQILGFNMEADLSKIASWLRENHRGLKLKDLHIDTYKVPDNKQILSFNELENIFFTNKDCYDHIREVMQNPPSKEIYNAYRYIYKALLTTDRNMEYFLVGENPVVDEYKALGYKSKFVDIPKKTTYYCKNCGAMVDFDKIINGIQTTCSICGRDISRPRIEEYHNESDYYRDYEWFLKDTDYETLYFVIRDDFDASHTFDLYIKEDESTLKNVGTARMAYTYKEYLRYKDPSLYSFINDILGITNIESRQEACVNAIQTLVSYLKDYIDQDGDDAIPLDTVFSGLPSISLDFVKKYVTEVIDFFKSFKIFTHGSSILYLITDRFDNYVQLIEHILLKYLFDKSDIVKIEDILEGKMEYIGGKLFKPGNGINVDISHKEAFDIIDKVWFVITTMLKKNYSDYYNSDNYTESDLRIRDMCERFDTYEYKDEAWSEHYIQEIQDYAVDAIVQTLVDIQLMDTMETSEDIKLDHNKQLEEFYNEWMADIIYLTFTKELDDKMRYQDDYIKTSFHKLHEFFPILDGKQFDIKAECKDNCTLTDDYYSIITKEVSPHTFDE